MVVRLEIGIRNLSFGPGSSRCSREFVQSPPPGPGVDENERMRPASMCQYLLGTRFQWLAADRFGF